MSAGREQLAAAAWRQRPAHLRGAAAADVVADGSAPRHRDSARRSRAPRRTPGPGVEWLPAQDGCTRRQLTERDGVLSRGGRPGRPTPESSPDWWRRYRGFPGRIRCAGASDAAMGATIRRILCAFDGQVVPFEIEGRPATLTRATLMGSSSDSAVVRRYAAAIEQNSYARRRGPQGRILEGASTSGRPRLPGRRYGLMTRCRHPEWPTHPRASTRDSSNDAEVIRTSMRRTRRTSPSAAAAKAA